MMKRSMILPLLLVWVGSVFAQAPASSSQSIRPVGAIAKTPTGNLTLHTDAGPELVIVLADGASFVRVPPGSTNLNAATKITLGDISSGDRVLLRGRISEDQKSILATAVIVMTQSDLASAREAERLDWQRRSFAGTVQALNPQTREITVTPNVQSTLKNPAESVFVALTPSSILLRYAPDSVKFTDAKPSSFEQIKIGDQVRALGTKNEDGSRFTAEKLVSATFRNLGVTVVSVDPENRTLSVKDLATGKDVRVRTNAASRLIRLPLPMAHAMAALSSGSSSRVKNGSDAGTAPLDVQQSLEHAPALELAELKAGDPLIVVTVQGENISEVMAIDVFAGVEPILAARPKGSSQDVLGSWSLGMSGGDGGP